MVQVGNRISIHSRIAHDDNIVARASDDTRPISLANSDSTICEIALDKPLAGAFATWANTDQRGFSEGRMMVDNIIEIDTHGRIAALTGGIMP